MAIAIIGLPPIAKISLMALVAAMRPKSRIVHNRHEEIRSTDNAVPLPRS